MPIVSALGFFLKPLGFFLEIVGINVLTARSVVSVFVVFLIAGACIAAAESRADEQAESLGNYSSVLNRYCVTCHNSALKTADLTLDQADITNISASPLVWERVVTKLSLSAMPPVGVPRPDQQFYEGFSEYLQSELDRSAQESRDPGRPTVHRLNRNEYANAIRDLLHIEINADELLPADNVGSGFDNIGEVLAVSPLLMERYLFAAGRIARLAVGPDTMQPASESYTFSNFHTQEERMSEDLPFGSRGGATVRHRFPLDGEYTLDIRFHKNLEGYIRGMRTEHTIDVRLDHKRVGTLTVGGEVHGRSGPIFTENQVVQYSGDNEQVGYEFTADEALQIRFSATAGTHLVGVSFVENNSKPTGIRIPRLTLPDIVAYKGGEPTVSHVIVTGPFDADGPGETESRKKIFSCNPATLAPASDKEACAKKILSTLARQAYRRPVRDDEVDGLLSLYRDGQNDGGFERGIELALQGIIAGPEFLFRIESDPLDALAGDVYAVSDLELASRLSFFLWSSAPDEELLAVAEQGRLNNPDVLRQQVRRMTSDVRFEAFLNNFGSQWLSIRNVDISEPNLSIFPLYDAELRDAFKQEMQLWFSDMVRQDDSVLDLLTSDTTYVNGRLARHYGIPDVDGIRFRSVSLEQLPERQGLWGKGGLLMATAYNNRTSPVVRGKWVLENLLNMPPPPPPEDVPALQVSSDGKALTLKQAMQKHRANPVCASCHKLMDPIGFAMENFDAIGSHRTRYVEADADVDASGLLFDGQQFESAEEFRGEFMRHSERVVHTVAEKVLTYALGRGLQYYDQPAVREIVRQSSAENYTWSSLIMGVIESTPFQYRRAASNDDI